MNTTSFASFNARLLSLGVCVLLSSLTGCSDKGSMMDKPKPMAKCNEHASPGADGSCVCDAGYVAGPSDTCIKSDVPVPDMGSGSLQCGEHGRVSGERCVCNEGYVTETASGPCLPQFDLQPAELSLGLTSSGDNYAICFRDSDDHIDIANKGVQDAPAYKIRLGFYSLASRKITGSCERNLTMGTKARSMTRLYSSGRDCSCVVPKASMPTGQYVVFVMADSGFQLKEVDEENNILLSEPISLLREDSRTEEVEVSPVRGVGGAASDMALPLWPAEVSVAQER